MEQTQKKTSIDDKPFTFGKHKGKTPNEVYEDDVGYLIWMLNNFKNGVPFSPEMIEKVQSIEEEDGLLQELDLYDVMDIY